MILQTTLLSCLSCLLLFQFSKTFLLPLLYQLTSSEKRNSPSTARNYGERYSDFEQKTNAQKFVSFVHGVVSTYGALVTVLSFQSTSIEAYAQLHVSPLTTHDATFSHRMKLYLEITLGYFIADLLLYMTDISKYSVLDIAHHVLSCVAYLIGLLSTYSTGSIVMICFQTNEISTPFYHLRYFMGLSTGNGNNNSVGDGSGATTAAETVTKVKVKVKGGWKQTKLYALNELVFSVLFCLFRVLYNAFVLLSVYRASQLDFSIHDHVTIGVLVVIGFLYYMVQLIWFFRIAQIVFYKLSSALSSRSSASKSASVGAVGFRHGEKDKKRHADWSFCCKICKICKVTSVFLW